MLESLSSSAGRAETGDKQAKAVEQQAIREAARFIRSQATRLATASKAVFSGVLALLSPSQFPSLHNEFLVIALYTPLTK